NAEARAGAEGSGLKFSTVDAIELSPPVVMPHERQPENYWSIVVRQFRKNRLSVAGLIIVLALFGCALFADFIANDKPLVMKYQGSIYFPAVRDYAVWLGLSQWPVEFQNIVFKDFVAQNFKAGDWAVFPPI